MSRYCERDMGKVDPHFLEACIARKQGARFFDWVTSAMHGMQDAMTGRYWESSRWAT